MAKKKEPTGSFIVNMRCVVMKKVYVEDCTEEQARNNPWEHATNEIEGDQIGWTVEGVWKIET